jgi:hypothetical protein
MARPRYALIVLIVVLCRGAAWGQSSLAPEAGVLVLKNGQVIDGDVTRAGDYYVVTKGEGSELRLKADEVEAFCLSLLEAYELKQRHLSGFSAKPHLDLARWCLRHQLHDQCRQQLAEAERQEPTSAQVKDLATRLKLAMESQPPPTVAHATAPAPIETIEQTLSSLPKGSVEKFGAIVQPILLNRCAANQCHGPNAKSEFRLLRPPTGQLVSRRFSQRNLYATLRYVDASAPEASPLIVLPQQRHGNSLAAVFDKHSANQLAELVAWARMTITPASPAARVMPATISPPQAMLSQPATSETVAIGKSVPAGAAGPESAPQNAVEATASVRVMRPPLDSAGLPKSARPEPVPRDRFDPLIFNRQYHGQ